jgi:chromosome segregation ATPase
MDDRNAPATKGDLQDLKGTVDHLTGTVDDLKGTVHDLAGNLEDFKVEVNTRFTAFEHRMEQLLSDMEGRIITSTYRLAESMQQRIKQTEGNQAAFNSRLATLEERLTEVEKRLNLPPQQTQ